MYTESTELYQIYMAKHGEKKKTIEKIDYYAVKIGHTKNDAKRRLSSLSSSEKFEIVFESKHRPWFKRFEKDFHDYFKKTERHIRGEYYLMSDIEISVLSDYFIEEEEQEIKFCDEYYKDFFERKVKP